MLCCTAYYACFDVGGQSQKDASAFKTLQHCLSRLLTKDMDLLAQEDHLLMALTAIAQPLMAMTDADGATASHFQDPVDLLKRLISHAR